MMLATATRRAVAASRRSQNELPHVNAHRQAAHGLGPGRCPGRGRCRDLSLRRGRDRDRPHRRPLRDLRRRGARGAVAGGVVRSSASTTQAPHSWV